MFLTKKWIRKNFRNIVGIFSAIACEIIFGFSFLCTKTVTNKYAAIDLLAWRFLLAATVLNLLFLMGLIHVKVPGKALVPMIGLGMLFPGGYYIFEALGVSLTTSSEVGLIVSSVPVLTLLLNMLITREIPGKIQVAGIILSIFGVVICVAAKGLQASFSWTGYVLIFLGLLFYCLYIILSKKVRDCSPVSRTYVILNVAVAVYFSAGLLRGIFCGTLHEFLLLPIRHHDFLYPMLYLGIMCSCVALALCNLGVQYIGATRFASFLGVETVVAILAGILILGESFTFVQVIGAIIVLIGVYLSNIEYTSGRH